MCGPEQLCGRRQGLACFVLSSHHSFPLRLGQLVTSLFCPNPPNFSRRPENVECAVRTLLHTRLALRQCIIGKGAKEDEGRRGRVERANAEGRCFFCPWCSLAIVAGSKITLYSCPPTPVCVCVQTLAQGGVLEARGSEGRAFALLVLPLFLVYASPPPQPLTLSALTTTQADLLGWL